MISNANIIILYLELFVPANANSILMCKMYRYQLTPEVVANDSLRELTSVTYQLSQEVLRGIYSRILLLNVSNDKLMSGPLILPFIFTDEQFITSSSDGLEITSEDVDKWFNCPLAFPLLFARIVTKNNEFPPHLYYYDNTGSIIHGDTSNHPKLSIGTTDNCKNTVVVDVPTPLSLDELSEFLSGFLLFDAILYRYKVIDIPSRFNLYVRGEDDNIILSSPIVPISGMDITSLPDNTLQQVILDTKGICNTVCKKFHSLLSNITLASRIERFNELGGQIELNDKEIKELSILLKDITNEELHVLVYDIDLEKIINATAIQLLIPLLEQLNNVSTILELIGTNTNILYELIKSPSYRDINKNNAICSLLDKNLNDTELFDQVFDILYGRTTVLSDITLRLLFRLGTSYSIEKVFDYQDLTEYYSDIALVSPRIYLKIRNKVSFESILDSLDKELIVNESALYMLIDDLPISRLLSLLKKPLSSDGIDLYLHSIIKILSRDIDLSVNNYEVVRMCLDRKNETVLEHILLHPSINTFFHGTNITILMLDDLDAIRLLHKMGTLIDYNKVISYICNKQFNKVNDLLIQVLEIFGYPSISDSSILATQLYMDNGAFNLLLKYTYDLNDDNILDAIIANIDTSDRIVELISHPSFDLLRVLDRLLIANLRAMNSPSKLLDIARDKHSYSLTMDLFERCISISNLSQIQELTNYLDSSDRTTIRCKTLINSVAINTILE